MFPVLFHVSKYDVMTIWQVISHLTSDLIMIISMHQSLTICPHPQTETIAYFLKWKFCFNLDMFYITLGADRSNLIASEYQSVQLSTIINIFKIICAYRLFFTYNFTITLYKFLILDGCFWCQCFLSLKTREVCTVACRLNSILVKCVCHNS